MVSGPPAATFGGMKEIRICRKKPEEPGETVEQGLWMPESPLARDAFEALVAAGNEAFGMHSHWLEEREVSSESTCGMPRPSSLV